MNPDTPLATGLTAPAHARGTVGFFLLGLFALLTLGAGLLSPNVGLAAGGVAALVAGTAGFALYWKTVARSPLAVLYPDHLDFVSGPQRGTLSFADISDARMLQWARSFFPYSRGHRLLVLRSGPTDWQVGPEIADYVAFQEAVVAAFNQFNVLRASPSA